MRLRDHLDSKPRLVFWLVTAVMATLTALQLVVALSSAASTWPALAVLGPLLAWCVGCVGALVWVIFRTEDVKERVMAVCGQVGKQGPWMCVSCSGMLELRF